MGSPEQTRQQRERWRTYSYVIAIVGAVGIPAAAALVRDAVQPATVTLVLVLVVLMAASLGGRGPSWTAAILGFLAFDLLHTTPYLRFHMDRIEELEIALVFAVIALIVGEIAVSSLNARETVLSAEFREARMRRVLSAASFGAGREQLIHMIEQELVDLFQLDTARYEPESRTTVHYRIDERGQLYHRADPLTGPQLRMPNEPVSMRVATGGRDLGQIVMIPQRTRPVDDEQLTLAASLAALLAGLLHEAHD